MKKKNLIPGPWWKRKLKSSLLTMLFLMGGIGVMQAQNTIQIGEDDGPSSMYFPIYTGYNYSYSQSIYTAEELTAQGGVAGEISKIRYQATTDQPTTKWKDWVIYIANTDKEGFENDLDWISTDEMTQVFDGEISDEVTADEWLEITLEEAFEWDGESNIVIAIDQNTEDWGDNPNWAGYDQPLEEEDLSRGIQIYSDSDNPDPDSPDQASGLTDVIAQIQFYGEILDDCDGDISPGTIEDTEISICEGVAFTITAEEASGPANGLERYWQSSPTGEDDWTNIENSDQSTLNLEEGIDEETDFRYVLVCNDAEPVYSDIVEVSLNSGEDCYCIPPQGGDNSDEILNFTLADLDNDSEASESTDGYTDYTESIEPVQLNNSQSYTASLTSGPGTGNHGAAIWIDYDDNGIFDENEKVAVYPNDIAASSTIEFPEFLVENYPGVHRLRVRYQYNASGDDLDPCEATTYSETEDYLVEVSTLDDCDGEVSAGTIEETELTVCANNSFDLVTENATEPANGLVRIWQSSPAGEDDWTDIEGATNSTYTLQEGIEEETDFRYFVSCNDEETDISEVIEISLNPSDECYCQPEGTNSDYYIDSFVTTNAQENISNEDSGYSENGYGDFTDMTVTQTATGEINFEANLEGGTAGIQIWVDWNQDGVFDEDEVAYQSSSYSTSHADSFSVPEDAELGITRMRIVNNYISLSGEADPCDTDYSYGEFEDYSFEVLELEDCTGTPDAGDAMDDFSICPEVPFQVSVEITSELAGGLEKTWQSSPAGEDDWTTIEETTDPTYFIEEGITEDTDYRYAVTCTNSDETEYSDVIQVSLNPENECYCIPTMSGDNSDEIVNFKLSDLDHDSTTEDGTDGYSDFTSVPPAQLTPGLEYVAELTSGIGSGNHGAAIWIDYNQDGSFDEEEMVAFIPNEINGSETVEFPAFSVDAAPGIYTLRIQYHHNKEGDELDPCETSSSFSETEDYRIEVAEVDCFPPHNIVIDYITDDSADVTWDAEEENSSWILYYGEEGFDPEADEGESVNVSDDPSTTLTNLDSETTYEIYIIATCDDDSESVLVGPKSFTTLPTPPENTKVCDAIDLEPNSGCMDGPYTNEDAFEESNEPIASCFNDFHGSNSVWFTFIAPANGEALITTDFNSTEFNTELAVYEAPEDCTDLSTLGEEAGCATAEDDLELSGLTPGETYYIQVAGFDDAEGEFCIEVQTDESEPEICQDPTDVSVGDVNDTSANVDWSAGGTETQWEVAYDEAGFNPDDEGESMTVSSTQVILSELQPETEYEVYVRALCTSDSTSDWVGPISFVTDELGVNDEIFDSFSFYPNPVENQLNLQANTSIEKIEVFNLLGQQVLTETPNNLNTQINTEKLEAGVYLLKVTIDGAEKTFRIVKK